MKKQEIKLNTEMLGVLRHGVVKTNCNSVNCRDCKVFNTCQWLDAQADYLKQFTRICASETCNKEFFVTDPRKIYCSTRCASLQSQREYRKRKRAKCLEIEEI